MGFLKDLSQDISQAMEELIPKELLEDDAADIEVNTLDMDDDDGDIEVNTLDEEPENSEKVIDKADNEEIADNTNDSDNVDESDDADSTDDGEHNKQSTEDSGDTEVLEESEYEINVETLESADNSDNREDADGSKDEQDLLDSIITDSMTATVLNDDYSDSNEQDSNDVKYDDDIDAHLDNEEVIEENIDEAINNNVIEEEDMIMADELNKNEIDSILSSLNSIENSVDEEAFDRTLDGDMTLHAPSYFDIDDGVPPTEEVTVISKGTNVGGGISASGSLEIYGNVNGNVECRGKLTILGNVKGSAKAAEVFINTSRFEGDIVSRGPVKIGVGTVVIGNVSGTSAVVAGAIKGEVDVTGPVILDSTAVVKGNLKVKSVQINNGAVVQGFCSLEYSDVDIDDFFEAEEFRK